MCLRLGKLMDDYSTVSVPHAKKSRTIAVLLALFLGGIGAHKFYLGQVATGLLYLLFCWTLIPGIIALLEAIRWLCMSNESFAGRY